MDVYKLKNHIINNPEYIELILEQSNFHKIINNYQKNEYRCAREEGRNPTSIRVNKQTLGTVCFSTNLKGDLITFVQSKLNLTFPQTIKKIAEMIGFKCENKPVENIILPFGGFFRKISKLRDEDDIELEVYSEKILKDYEVIPNKMFYKDGISTKVQMDYSIGYDSLSGRIVLPWYSFSSELIGIMGRLNKEEVSEDESKWLPIIPFPKSKTIYGFSHNYHSIREKEIVMIGESEKHTLQLSSKGLDIGVSLGGSFMSELQANNIKSLFPKKIIIMLDEGIKQEHSLEIAKQLKMNNFYKNNVGYIYDKDNQFLPKDSKLAPSDLDKNTLKKLINNCTIWI